MFLFFVEFMLTRKQMLQCLCQIYVNCANGKETLSLIEAYLIKMFIKIKNLYAFCVRCNKILENLESTYYIMDQHHRYSVFLKSTCLNYNTYNLYLLVINR